jgi:hypothetical protein
MTVKYQIVYWRDIPAQVKVREGRKRHGRPLEERFEKAIDQAAMQAGLVGSDDYLNEWRAGEWQEQEGTATEVAEAIATELEAAYTNQRLRAIAKTGGYESA